MSGHNFRRGKKIEGYTISAVSEKYGVHPQTLRIYEREGLLKPFRSAGNTRYYTDRDLERLEAILALTREMGVNLAGVEVILKLRDQMEHMKAEMSRFLEVVHAELSDRLADRDDQTSAALVPQLPFRFGAFVVKQRESSSTGATKARSSDIQKKGGDLNP